MAVRAPPEARRHRRAISTGCAPRRRVRDRRGERDAARREPARQRIAVPQRQDHAGPGAARARGAARGAAAGCARRATSPSGAQLSQLPAEPPARRRRSTARDGRAARCRARPCRSRRRCAPLRSQNRPEIGELERGIARRRLAVRLARADLKPTLSLGVDAGTQGEEYEFGRGRNFGMISLLLNWQLFDGGASRARGTRRARRRASGGNASRRSRAADPARSAAGARSAADDQRLARHRRSARRSRAAPASASPSRKRDEGVINQVEFIDSRNSLTSAELNLNVTRLRPARPPGGARLRDGRRNAAAGPVRRL